MWKILESQPIADYKVFSVRRQRSQSVRTGKEGEFFVLDSRDWVNIIALTESRQIILIEQYRHGTDEVTLEIPGGCVDPMDKSPLEAAKRELLEETGYSSSRWRQVGKFAPNPAIQSNWCHVFVAENVQKTAEQRLDSNEEIKVRLDRLENIPRYIVGGQIDHGVIVAAFHYYTFFSKGRRSSSLL